ncbi:hypothetical protein SLA_0763 [Streptomyces laurentii]|uniref:Uncharacterized protein n=1 Tax=Streptomyces laurentii TaxID=39478 RepID=A0A160NTC5_STRLU|nr:hypothetical protein SLA_0763 [Streptomyces laurentii]
MDWDIERLQEAGKGDRRPHPNARVRRPAQPHVNNSPARGPRDRGPGRRTPGQDRMGRAFSGAFARSDTPGDAPPTAITGE